MEEKKESKIHTFLSFQLGDEIFAASVTKVLEILELRPITRVPKSPDYMKGVINLRGTVLPVIDMRTKFALPIIEATQDTCIIVLNVEVEEELIVLGAQVDAVREVLEIPENTIEPAPNIGSKYRSEFIQGMWKKDDNFVMLLNIDKVFSYEEIAEVKETKEEEVAEEKESDE